MTENNFSQLLKLAQNGDKPAYSLFLTECTVYLRMRLKKWIKRSEIREEITQDILIGIHRNLHTYRPELRAEAWIIGIAHYKVIDYFRKNPSRFQEVNIDSIHGQIDDVTNNSKETNSSIDELDAIFKNLSPTTKNAIILTKIDGLSTKEAADKLGLKENALRTRISRALQKIKEEFSS